MPILQNRIAYGVVADKLGIFQLGKLMGRLRIFDESRNRILLCDSLKSVSYDSESEVLKVTGTIRDIERISEEYGIEFEEGVKG